MQVSQATPYQLELARQRQERLARMNPVKAAPVVPSPANDRVATPKPKPRDVIRAASPVSEDFIIQWPTTRPITLRALGKWEAKRTAGSKFTARRALHWASVFSGVPVNLILSTSRMRQVVFARRVAIWLIYNHYMLRSRVWPYMPMISLPAIGTLMGGLHHTTILHALRAMQKHYPKRAYISQNAQVMPPRVRNDY